MNDERSKIKIIKKERKRVQKHKGKFKKMKF